jgi:ubiquinone/menaquinone biosynthesis C-methylase UbiE
MGQEHFDEAAKTWDKNIVHIQRTEAIKKELLSRLHNTKDMTALEFGAGTGLLSFALREYFSDIVMMDNSLEMHNISKSKIIESNITNLHAVFFDLEKDDYKDKTFDVIFSQMVLHHVTDIKAILHKFYNLLNPNGIIAIADLYKEDGSFHNYDFKGHNGFDIDKLVNLIKEEKFIKIEHKPCFIVKKPYSNDIIKEFPIFLLTAIKE